MSDTVISAERLSKRFGKLLAVDGLTFQINRGRVCGFLGRNGAGKTTTIRMLMGLLEPSAGAAHLLGLDARHHRLELMRRVGYVGEAPVMPGWMRVGELVRFNASFYNAWDHGRINGLLRHFGLDFAQKVEDLSRGMKSQLALALALGHDPEVLILDEPTAGLDVLVRRNFLESVIDVIQREGRTVLFSSHLVHEVERVADHIVMIEAGRLVTSMPADSLKQRVKRIVVRVSGKPNFTTVSGLLRVRTAGHEHVLTVRDYDERTKVLVQELGAEILEVTGTSLEEAFIELAGQPGSMEVIGQ